MTTAAQDENYWYYNRNDLNPGQAFLVNDGSFVKLDSRVEGDGTKWTVADWFNGHWSYEGSEIEPGDLRGKPIDGNPTTEERQ